jgi:hypothetical protein
MTLRHLLHDRRRRSTLAAAAVGACALVLASCGPTKFEAELNVPPPLVSKIPIVVGVYLPEEFSNRVYEEKRRDYSISVAIGKAQSDGFMRLMTAMFDRAVPVQGTTPASITDPEMRGILEPVLEDFSFITPRDSNAPVYAVSVKYRINGYNRAGQIFDSWTFTGYGSVESSTMGIKGTNALKAATGLAMRDAAAKLAAEFREQAIVRGLLPGNAPLVPVVPPAGGSQPSSGAPAAAAGAAATGATSPAGEQPAPATEGAAPAGQPPTGEQPPAGEQSPGDQSSPKEGNTPTDERAPTDQAPTQPAPAEQSPTQQAPTEQAPAPSTMPPSGTPPAKAPLSEAGRAAA